MSLLEDFDVVATGSNLVLGDGPTSARIVIIGEAPAKQELIQRKPLVGPTGEALNEHLNSIQVLRKDVYCTNLFKFAVNKMRTPERLFKGNNLVWHSGSGFTELGKESCNELIEELETLSPNVLVPLGAAALHGLCNLKGITKYRGSILWHEHLQCKVIPLLHPASAFHDKVNQFLISLDMRKVKEQQGFPELKLTKRDLIIFPTFTEVKFFLQDIIDHKRQPVSFDLETSNNQVTHIAVGYSPTQAMSIQFIKAGVDIFSSEQELEIWQLLTIILEDKTIKKEGQNLAYDNGFLFKRLGIIVRNFDDSMIGIKTAYPGLRMGLDTIASIYTDIPYYKDEGKQHNFVRDEKQYAEYNAKDAITVSDAMPKIKADLERLNNMLTYETQKQLVPVILYMGQRGIKVHEEGIVKAQEECEIEAKCLQEELNTLVGEELNPRSTKQLQDYFYARKNIKPYLENGKATTNERALMQLAAGTSTRPGLREASLILEIRRLQNRISKEYDLAFENGRLTTAYMPVTSTGRLSSTKDVFGQGTNIQNRKGKIINKYFVADDGYLLYSADYGQADNRSVAYLGPEPRMIKAFEDKVDIHSQTASYLFDIPIDEIQQQAKEDIVCPLGNGALTYRDYGKRCNHALNFGLGVNKFALQLETTRELAKQLHRGYHTVYPGVQNGYQESIRRALYGHAEHPKRQLVNCFGRVWLYLGSLSELTEAFAFPAQSNTADAVNRFGLIPLYHDKKFEQIDLLRQVHDSIDFQIPLNIGIDEHARLLHEIRSSMETPLHWQGRDFILPINIKVGFALEPMAKINWSKDLKTQLEQYFKAESCYVPTTL